MRNRLQALSGLAVVLLAACAAEGRGPGASDAASDPDRSVAGGGVFVDGWATRFDDPAATRDQIRFVREGADYRVSVGPNVVLWHPQSRAERPYRLSVDVAHLDSLLHDHGAGLVFGARDLDGAGIAYTYFLVHGGGKFLIKRRDGDETTEIVPFTAHGAVYGPGPDGITNNRLAVEVGAQQTRFLVNDVEVHKAPNDALHVDGVYGFRLVHNLEIRFANLALVPGS